jgi:phage RecT family recombinase
MSTQARPQEQQRNLALVRRDEILDFVGKYGGEIDKLAPRGMDAAYQVASLRLYFQSHPELLDCKPLSIATGILRVAQTGLTLGVSCDLLPFGQVCQYSPRYTGIAQLALAAGTRAINLGVVREGDHFRFMKGTSSFVEHQPIAKSDAPIIWGYALAEIKQGAFSIEIMSREAIDAHRRRYSKSWWKDKKGNVIPLEEIPWYGKKTPMRQLAPVLPQSPRLSAALMFAKEVEEEEIPEGSFEVEREPGEEEEVRKPVAAPRLIEGEEVQNDRELDDFPGRGRR